MDASHVLTLVVGILNYKYNFSHIIGRQIVMLVGYYNHLVARY